MLLDADSDEMRGMGDEEGFIVAGAPYRGATMGSYPVNMESMVLNDAECFTGDKTSSRMKRHYFEVKYVLNCFPGEKLIE